MANLLKQCFTARGFESQWLVIFFVFWHFVSLRPDYVKKFFFCKILVWNERIETKNEAEVGLYLKTNAIVISECTIKATNHKWSAWKFYFWFQFGIHSFSHTIAFWVFWIFVNGIAAAAACSLAFAWPGRDILLLLLLLLRKAAWFRSFHCCINNSDDNNNNSSNDNNISIDDNNITELKQH